MGRINIFRLRALAGAICLAAIACAQPSGGPYGPVQQRYEVPEVTGMIYYVSPEGDRMAKGDSPDRTTLLEAAIERVVTGDVIVLRGGIYRTGNLMLNQGITMQPYLEEQPVIKGSRVADHWEQMRAGLWRTSWTTLFPSQPAGWWRRERNIALTPLHRFNDDMVFVDGRFLQSAGSKEDVDPHTFYIDYENQWVYIGTDPSEKLIEITAFNSAMIRTTGECHGKVSDKTGPVIRGITFTQYAYRALEVEGTFPEGLQDEAQFGKEVTGTVIEHCEISFCSRVAAYLKGDDMVIRHCKVSDTSTEGLYIQSSSDVLLERNIFARNNIEKITGYYPAAVKIFNQTRRVMCRDNLITDHPHSNGIWYDVGNVDGRFVNNWVRDVGMIDHDISYSSVWPSQNGFFFEISKGAVVAGNVFENCDHGILVLNSSGVELYNNTLINSMLCIARDERSAQGDHFGWHPSTGPDVEERYGHVLVNNLMVAEEGFKRPLLMVWQPGSLCERLPEHPFKQMDHNVYVHAGSRYPVPMILWSPASAGDCQVQLSGPGELHAVHPALSGESLFLTGKEHSLFPGSEEGHFNTPAGFNGHAAAVPVPEAIRALFGEGWPDTPYVGACPAGE